VDTKLKGDIAEQAAILQALEHGWGVLKPVGDRLPYDLVLDVERTLVKVQVKWAWFDEARGNYVVDNRRSKTNRRRIIKDSYSKDDFDFALVYVPELSLFYVFPVGVFVGYGSEIHLIETNKRQRKPRSAAYRGAWDLILQWASCGETCMRTPVKFGETVGGVIPSQAFAVQVVEEGVET
jgi:hypothetical protein